MNGDAPLLDVEHRRVFDVSILVVATIVVVLSMLLTPDPLHLSLFGWPLPPLCLFKLVTGHECPGCGLTRSFTYMGHLDVLAALQMHKLGPALYLFVAAQIPWRVVQLVRRSGPKRAAPVS